MEVWIDEFRDTIDQDTKRLMNMSEAEATTSPGDGKWSPKEVIGHLIDSAANNHQRFVRAQFTDDLVGPPYDQEAWVQSQKYIAEPWLQLVQLWSAYNLHLCHLMATIPSEITRMLRAKHNLDRIAWVAVSSTEPVTLEYFMQDYIAHLRHHLQQIPKGSV